MKQVAELRDRCLKAIQDLEMRLHGEKQRLATLDEVLRAMRGETGPMEAQAHPARRQRTKGFVIDLINAAGDVGVTAAEIVAKAAEDGRDLKQGSVSSLLSKLKADNVLTFDGERYHQKRPQPPTDPAPGLKVVSGGA